MKTEMIQLISPDDAKQVDAWLATNSAAIIKHVVCPYPGAVLIFYEEV